MPLDVLANTCQKKKTGAVTHLISNIIQYFTYEAVVCSDGTSNTTLKWFSTILQFQNHQSVEKQYRNVSYKIFSVFITCYNENLMSQVTMINISYPYNTWHFILYCPIMGLEFTNAEIYKVACS